MTASIPDTPRYRLRDQIVDWMEDARWTHFLTLNFKEDTTECRARQAVGRFLKGVRRKLVGRRGTPCLPCMVAFERGSSDKLHAHILLELPMNRSPASDIAYIRATVAGLWESASACTAPISLTCPDRISWCEQIEAGMSYAHYISKEIAHRPDGIQFELCETRPLRRR